MMRRLLLIFSVLFVGCVKEIPLKTKETAPASPVVHLFIKAGTPVSANFQRVTAITSPAFYSNAAQIGFFRNSNPLFWLASSGNGNYASTSFLNPRDSFNVRIKDANDSFNILGVVPNRVDFQQVDTLMALVGGIGQSFSFRIQFADSAQYDNFYRLYIYKQGWRYILNNNVITDSVAFEEPISIACNDLSVVQNSYNNYTNRELLLTDQTFNGIQKELLVHCREQVQRNSKERWVKTVLYLENVSESLFDFYNTRNAHIWQQQSITQIPGLIKVNIPNGFGVCGAYTEARKEILLR